MILVVKGRMKVREGEDAGGYKREGQGRWCNDSYKKRERPVFSH